MDCPAYGDVVCATCLCRDRLDSLSDAVMMALECKQLKRYRAERLERERDWSGRERERDGESWR